MKLLHFTVRGATLFANDTFSMDLFATNRVVGASDGAVEDVTKVGDSGAIYSLNAVGISGVNASGKTTALNLFRFVLSRLSGEFSARRFKAPYDRLGKVSERLSISAIFHHYDDFYLVESSLVQRSQRNGDYGYDPRNLFDSFVYEDETLWRLHAPRVNRSMLADPDTFKLNAEVLLVRNAKPGEMHVMSADARLLLDDRASIASFVTNRVQVSIESPDRELPLITMPAEVVQAFDGSVERLAWDSDAQVFHLKFKGEDERVVGMDAAVAMLSRGTVYGAELVDHAIEVLRQGGYLIIDEIEESLNRALVGVVLDLFSSPVTNPRGAQLVFSTHYPELLDSLHRKDAIYVLVRDGSYHTHIVNYSDVVDRIELKKSEVILSNVIKGSMPKYPDVQAMREYVKRRVDE